MIKAIIVDDEIHRIEILAVARTILLLLLVTVIVQIAVLLPSRDVAVIVAVPTASPVINPLAVTVAIELLPEVQRIFLFVALVGIIVAVNCFVPFTLTDPEAGLTVTPVAATLLIVPPASKMSLSTLDCIAFISTVCCIRVNHWGIYE